MDTLESICYFFRFIFTPIHEIGHFIFGWLSFNPTIIVAWDEVGVMRDGWVVSFGGMFTEIVFFFLVAYFIGKRTRFIYPWTIAMTGISLLSIWFQTDQEGHGALMPLLWYISGIASIVWQIFLIRRQPNVRPRRTKMERNQSGTIPKDPKGYLRWLNAQEKR